MANQTEQEKTKEAAEKAAAEPREKQKAADKVNAEEKDVKEGMPKPVVQAVQALQYRDSQGTPALDDNRKPIMRGGNPVMTYHPHMRPMTVADVVSYSINGSVLVIVSSDGMKHRVMMNGKP